MILSLGFSLNVEISGNMKNQINPFPHNSEFVTRAQMLCFINSPGTKCFGMQISKTNDFLLWDFYEKRIFPIRKRMFAISPDRICKKSDPNLGLE